MTNRTNRQLRWSLVFVICFSICVLHTAEAVLHNRKADAGNRRQQQYGVALTLQGSPPRVMHNVVNIQQQGSMTGSSRSHSRQLTAADDCDCCGGQAAPRIGQRADRTRSPDRTVGGRQVEIPEETIYMRPARFHTRRRDRLANSATPPGSPEPNVSSNAANDTQSNNGGTVAPRSTVNLNNNGTDGVSPDEPGTGFNGTADTNNSSSSSDNSTDGSISNNNSTDYNKGSDNSTVTVKSAPPDSNVTLGGGNSTVNGSSGGVRPSAVCARDVNFAAAQPTRTTCRFFSNFITTTDETGSNIRPRRVTYLCTAWFMGPNHMVTAGHCVSDGDGKYGIDASDPGYVCCKFQDTDGPPSNPRQPPCQPGWQWNVTKWVTTVGWLTHGSEHNDGAVLEVVPTETSGPQRNPNPVVQSITSYHVPKDNRWNTIPAHSVYMDGYPGAQPEEFGCSGLNTSTRYEVRDRVTATSRHNGHMVEFPIGGCEGQSGGRVILQRPNAAAGQAYGIQTYGERFCDERDQGLTGVTLLTRSSTACGVCVTCLRDQLTRGERNAGGNSTSRIAAAP